MSMQDSEYELHNDLFPRREDSMPLCAECTLCQGAGLGFVATQIVWGNGCKDARLMVVGNDSARGDDSEPIWKGSKHTLIPLTDRESGAKLRILLWKAGVNPFSVFVTNSVKCNSGCEQGHPDYPRKVVACLEHLREEIARVGPQIIIPLGEKPAERLRHVMVYGRFLQVEGLPQEEILSNPKCFPFVGSLPEAPQNEIQVIPLRHPCRLRGKAETRYQRNLEVIAERLR